MNGRVRTQEEEQVHREESIVQHREVEGEALTGQVEAGEGP